MPRILAAVVLVSVLAFSASATQSTQQLTVVARKSQVFDYTETSSITIPGYSRTTCYGTGSVIYLSTSCSSFVLPPTEIPLNVSRREVYQEVIENGQVYTLHCTGRLGGNSCNDLFESDSFSAQVKANKMWIEGRRGGNRGKPVRLKFEILDLRPAQNQPVSTASVSPQPNPQAAPIAQQGFPRLSVPDGWMRKDGPEEIILIPVGHTAADFEFAVAAPFQANASLASLLTAFKTRALSGDKASVLSEALPEVWDTHQSCLANAQVVAAAVNGTQMSQWYGVLGCGTNFIYFTAAASDKNTLLRYLPAMKEIIAGTTF